MKWLTTLEGNHTSRNINCFPFQYCSCYTKSISAFVLSNGNFKTTKKKQEKKELQKKEKKKKTGTPPLRHGEFLLYTRQGKVIHTGQEIQKIHPLFVIEVNQLFH